MTNKINEGNRFLPNYASFPFAKDETIDKNKICLVHLNGVAGYSFDEKIKKNSNKFNEKDLSIFSKIDVEREKRKRGKNTELESYLIYFQIR